MEIYRCNHCGNIAVKLEDHKVPLVCCGEKMALLEAKSQDAGVEKHLPVVTRENGKLVVTCGSVLHPMTEEHHIGWLLVTDGKNFQIKYLKPGETPSATFEDIPHGEAYSYCNLHGLWKVAF